MVVTGHLDQTRDSQNFLFCDPIYQNVFLSERFDGLPLLMIRANVSSQISRSIFVYGEIIQMHTFSETNCTVIKLPRNGNNKAI